MRVIVGKYPPREAGADDVWVALVTREVGRGSRTVSLASSAWHMNPTVFLTVIAIIARMGETISLKELNDHCYGDLRSGGADARSIEACLCRARDKLARIGIIIGHRYGWGYYLA